MAGDSAGGNLAAVVAQRAQREGGPTISLQVLIYPVTDADLNTPSYLDEANQLMVSRDTMIWFWDHYLPDAAVRANPDASPLQGSRPCRSTAGSRPNRRARRATRRG